MTDAPADAARPERAPEWNREHWRTGYADADLYPYVIHHNHANTALLFTVTAPDGCDTTFVGRYTADPVQPHLWSSWSLWTVASTGAFLYPVAEVATSAGSVLTCELADIDGRHIAHYVFAPPYVSPGRDYSLPCYDTNYRLAYSLPSLLANAGAFLVNSEDDPMEDNGSNGSTFYVDTVTRAIAWQTFG